jgi:hypothetical protein
MGGGLATVGIINLFLQLQNPDSPFRKDDDIYTRIAPELKRVAKALKEYQDCLNRNPRASEYKDRINAAALKSAIPIPSTTSVGRATYNGSKAYRAGKAVFTFANVYKPLVQGTVFTLMVNSVFFSADAQILRN